MYCLSRHPPATGHRSLRLGYLPLLRVSAPRPDGSRRGREAFSLHVPRPPPAAAASSFTYDWRAPPPSAPRGDTHATWLEHKKARLAAGFRGTRQVAAGGPAIT